MRDDIAQLGPMLAADLPAAAVHLRTLEGIAHILELIIIISIMRR